MATRIEELPVGKPSDIEDWVERFTQYAIIHDAVTSATTPEEVNLRKVALLLSSVGAEGYKLIKAYTAPQAPNSKTYDELIACIMTNLAPKPSQISESYKFAQLKQEGAETLAMFMGRVKSAASKCNYGDTYDRMVMDKFICGIKTEKIKIALINDATIDTSAMALQKALSREHSETAAHNMSCNYVKPKFGKASGSKQNRQPFKAAGSKPQNSNHSQSNKCSRCNRNGHKAEECKTKCFFV